MKIRLSQTEDIPAIMAIYDVARQFMKDIEDRKSVV